MEQGIFYDMPMDEYKKIPAAHKSEFKYILKSGLHYRHHLENRKESTDSMVFGNLVDTLLFEPHLLEKRFVTVPETYPAIVKKEHVDKPWSWNANFCKDWRSEILEDNPGIEIVKGDDIIRATNITSAIESHPEAVRYLDGARFQVTMIWRDPETKVWCKGRLDAVTDDRFIDLKVTEDPHPEAFSGIMTNFDYHVQGAFYHDGWYLAQGMEVPEEIKKPFSFIAVESGQPHDVVCYNIGIESFEAGRVVYHEALRRYADFLDTNEYVGYSNVSEEIEIRQWKLNRIMLDGVVR